MTEEAAFPSGKGFVSSCTKIQQFPHLVFPGSWLYCSKILCRIACAPSFLFGPEAVSEWLCSPCPPSPCPSQALSLVLPQGLIPVSGRGEPFGGLVRLWRCTAPPAAALLGTERRTNNQVFLTRTAVLAAMCAHSPGCSYTSRRKRPEK